jgi:pimeloyl-ACP methyl ester carboxylesterase
VLAPHPITWSAEQDYSGGLDGLRRGYHAGWRGLADRYQVVIAMPYGHHRRVDLCSLASPEQIGDMAHLIELLPTEGYSIDISRIYACGLSMGGQEALVLAGKYPDRIAAVVAFNPIVDLAAWQQDLATTNVEEIREFDTASKIVAEVGRSPEACPAAYAERSPIEYADSLAQVSTLVYWSAKDLVVPGQLSRHSYRLYQAVKAISDVAPIAEYEHTRSHGVTSLNYNACWMLHEWCDYNLALTWLLTHQQSPGIPRHRTHQRRHTDSQRGAGRKEERAE